MFCFIFQTKSMQTKDVYKMELHKYNDTDNQFSLTQKQNSTNETFLDVVNVTVDTSNNMLYLWSQNQSKLILEQNLTGQIRELGLSFFKTNVGCVMLAFNQLGQVCSNEIVFYWSVYSFCLTILGV